MQCLTLQSGTQTAFPLDYQMTTANTTIVVQSERIKIIPILFVRSAKKYIFGVLQNFSN